MTPKPDFTPFRRCECGATTWFDVPRDAFTSISVVQIPRPAWFHMPTGQRLKALGDLVHGPRGRLDAA